MNKPARTLLKGLAWLYFLLPLITLIANTAANRLGPDPTATLALATGLAALSQLNITLAISPLRRLWKGFNDLIQIRRAAGLFAFFYASLHLLIYIALYAGFDPAAIVTDVAKRRFILAGAGAWLLMLPLALTSTQRAIRRLGGQRWSRLHRLTYLVVILANIHYWLKVKTGDLSPMGFSTVTAVLLLLRPVQSGLAAFRRSRDRGTRDKGQKTQAASRLISDAGSGKYPKNGI